jgi:bifunctional UDP-N-acetylglucosamine pyrophosphorylase/glucosamine-1-phosphate N-acetyltransferase
MKNCAETIYEYIPHMEVIVTCKSISPGSLETMQPLNCRRQLGEISVAGITLAEWQQVHFGTLPANYELSIRIDLWPSPVLRQILLNANQNLLISGADGEELVKLKVSRDDSCQQLQLDADSFLLRYPWDILKINEQVISNINDNNLRGIVREHVTIDGNLHLGAGSVILPGVFIEGKVMVGENCKIGPNCYLRGNTCIGNNCHIGQAVEIKNSLIMDNVSIGHLSYLGDSIVCPKVNFGAGTITANLRHDGKNHRSAAGNMLVDTGRRKFGTIVGDNVHTGIHTSIYPGRKFWPDVCTKPGDIVAVDIK